MRFIPERFLPARLRRDSVTIPVVRLQGTIASGGTSLRPALSLAACAPALHKAFADKRAPAVAIIVNSPGGSPVQSHLIHRRIRALAAEHDRKVLVFVEDVAASGGYMIAAAGDEIIADPSSIVGSIGVVSAMFGFHQLIERIGVERRVYTAGRNKAMLDAFQPEKAEDVEHLKAIQLEMHETFIALVRERRGARLADDPELFTGMFWTGARGKELGLVDELGDLRSVIRQRYGDKARLRLIQPPRSLFGMRPGVGADARSVGAGAAEGMIGALEERALWGRYGL